MPILDSNNSYTNGKLFEGIIIDDQCEILGIHNYVGAEPKAKPEDEKEHKSANVEAVGILDGFLRFNKVVRNCDGHKNDNYTAVGAGPLVWAYWS